MCRDSWLCLFFCVFPPLEQVECLWVAILRKMAIDRLLLDLVLYRLGREGGGKNGVCFCELNFEHMAKVGVRH